MPTFEDMQKKYSNVSTVGKQLKTMSNMVMNETFSNSTDYRVGKIYDCYMNEIQEIDFKFLKVATFTISKDQVEYMVQFRPGVNPEIDFDTSEDQKHRISFYIDILDANTNLYNKWLIVGKDISEFDKYNILKCNWTFEWLDEKRIYHSCLGCLRDRNSYNSGVWSDGTTTTIENQTMFILPNNDFTKTITYGNRFMVTDNEKYPKVYETTKLMDTFPLGNIKVVLSQAHYNEHVDICKKIDIGDGQGEVMHMICNYGASTLPPIVEEKSVTSWSLSNVGEYLYIGGQPQVIYATSNEEDGNGVCEWHIFVDNKEYQISDLMDYFDIEIDSDKNALSICAINKVMVKYIIKIAIYDADKTYYDFAEMEVSI